MTSDRFILLDDRINCHQLLFDKPVDIFVADNRQDVNKTIKAMEKAHRQGLYLAGYASYELGYVLENKLLPLMSPVITKQMTTPLLCFAAFNQKPQIIKTDQTEGGYKFNPSPANSGITKVKPGWSLAQYRPKFDKTIEYIKAGDIFQANLSFPLYGQISGDYLDVYYKLIISQPVSYAAVIALQQPYILSFSPEMFFSITDNTIVTRPMKGTAPRGKNQAQDKKIKQWLANDDKSRAENLMIVDLLRNDIGRICQIGSVGVSELFKIEEYKSLYQVTSKVYGSIKDNMNIGKLFASLFPCGSVTGAPKIRAMEIIHELETMPRNAYCGAIGFIAPNGNMQFNVSIRTMILQPDNSFIFNVGSAIVADSICKSEYEECLLKAKFLTRLLRSRN